MNDTLNYKRLNENTLLIEWPAVISETVLTNILRLQKAIQTTLHEQIIESYLAYHSLSIAFNPDKIAFEDLVRLINSLQTFHPSETVSVHRWILPVCYEGAYGPDLENLAHAKKISPAEVIQLHTAPVYKVYFFGFLPGFMYLGGLDTRLHFPRKSTPSQKVKPGSVAIGGQQTGIYPSASPAGWHIIGSCPIPIFNPMLTPPCRINPLDEIVFQPVSQKVHDTILQNCLSGTYSLTPVSHG